METQTIKQENKICCPKCKSERVKKRGFRHTENRGKIQRYECKECKNAFVIDDGFFRMRNAPQKITLCLDLFYRGVSTRKVQEHLQAFYPHNSSWVSIYSWIVKYSEMIGNFTDKLKIKASEELQIDEVEYRVNKRKAFFIDSIDTETRFMVASKFVRNRTSAEIKSVLKQVKYKTDDQIKVVTSDGFNAYISAVKVMGVDYRKTKNPSVIHHPVTQLKNEGFNHKIERMHSNVRERTKVFRGFGSINGAYSIMKGYEIFHNFIRKHQAINSVKFFIESQNDIIKQVKTGKVAVPSILSKTLVEPTHMLYKRRQEEYLAKLDSGIKVATREIERLQKRYDDWKLIEVTQ